MNVHKLLTYALNKDGKLVHIDTVPRGAECNCFCPNCKSALVAKNGGEKREHHFAHEANSDCLKGYQTALHLLGKEIILKEKQIPIINEKFEIEFINSDSIELEKKLDDIIPDVYALVNNKPVAIEILVTHEVDDNKYNKIQNHEITTFEIDLSKVDTLEYEQVKNEIYNLQNIHIIYDKYFYDNILNYKKEIILKNGIQKRIENGYIQECPMSCFVARNGLIPRKINSQLCNLCLVSYKPDDSQKIFCMGHINGNLPDWFVRADIINDKYLTLSEASKKIETFKANIRRLTV